MILPLIIVAVILLSIYSVPGLFMARGIYAQEVRAIGRKRAVVVPPKPKRPEIKLSETLHDFDKYNNFATCGLLRTPKKVACNCSHRKEWVKLKNAWLDYEEWQHDYGHIKNGVVSVPKINNAKVFGAILLWPGYLAVNFVKQGAAMIPDYEEIERLERELREIE